MGVELEMNTRTKSQTKSTPRFFAIWHVEGKERLVLPRSKKRMSFPSIATAYSALERRGNKCQFDTRGVVKNASGQEVGWIAL